MNNIVLIGMPGAGKSTIGVVLAKVLGKKFIDTDILIQEREQKLLQEILDEKGTMEFLKIEEKVLMSAAFKNTVIATGGSAVYSESAMENLKRNGISIYLKLPYNEIKNRLQDITTRGVVMGNNQSLLDIYKERIPLYEKYADLEVDCEGRSVESIVEEIAGKTNEQN